MKNLLLVCSILSAATATTACEYGATKHATALNTAWLTSSAIVVADGCQTIWASDNGKWDRMSAPGMKYQEMNPLLGTHPSVAVEGAVLATDLIINTAIRFAPIKEWIKLAWFGGIIVGDGYTVATNLGGARCVGVGQ